MEDVLFYLALLFTVGMLVLMFKYAKFIHNQPKMEEKRRQEGNKENHPSDESPVK